MAHLTQSLGWGAGSPCRSQPGRPETGGRRKEKGCRREHPVPLLPAAVPKSERGEHLTQAELPGELLARTAPRGQESEITV